MLKENRTSPWVQDHRAELLETVSGLVENVPEFMETMPKVVQKMYGLLENMPEFLLNKPEVMEKTKMPELTEKKKMPELVENILQLINTPDMKKNILASIPQTPPEVPQNMNDLLSIILSWFKDTEQQN